MNIKRAAFCRFLVLGLLSFSGFAASRPALAEDAAEWDASALICVCDCLDTDANYVMSSPVYPYSTEFTPQATDKESCEKQNGSACNGWKLIMGLLVANQKGKLWHCQWVKR